MAGLNRSLASTEFGAHAADGLLEPQSVALKQSAGRANPRGAGAGYAALLAKMNGQAAGKARAAEMDLPDVASSSDEEGGGARAGTGCRSAAFLFAAAHVEAEGEDSWQRRKVREEVYSCGRDDDPRPAAVGEPAAPASASGIGEGWDADAASLRPSARAPPPPRGVAASSVGADKESSLCMGSEMESMLCIGFETDVSSDVSSSASENAPCRRAAWPVNASPPSGFVPSASFAGRKEGKVFKRGAAGVGYYTDAHGCCEPAGGCEQAGGCGPNGADCRGASHCGAAGATAESGKAQRSQDTLSAETRNPHAGVVGRVREDGEGWVAHLACAEATSVVGAGLGEGSVAPLGIPTQHAKPEFTPQSSPPQPPSAVPPPTPTPPTPTAAAAGSAVVSATCGISVVGSMFAVEDSSTSSEASECGSSDEGDDTRTPAELLAAARLKLSGRGDSSEGEVEFG